MSPLEKHELVEELQELEHCVAMVGDGANDCGALRVADVGISLSETEASLAAPFCSAIPTIACAPQLVREGRCALATSFASFKYMTLYSAVQFTTVCLLRWFNVNLSAYQFICFDMLTVLALGWALTAPGPRKKLDPIRPTASLLSAPVLASILSQVGVVIAFQCFARFWIPCATLDISKTILNPDTDEKLIMGLGYNQILVPYSAFQYIWTAVIYSFGGKYREGMMGNIRFVITVSLLVLFHTALLFGWLLELFKFLDWKALTIAIEGYFKYTKREIDFAYGPPTHDNANFKIVGLALLNLLVCLAVESLLVPAIVSVVKAFKRRQLTAREKLEAISIDDLEKSDLPVRKNLNKKPIMKKL